MVTGLCSWCQTWQNTLPDGTIWTHLAGNGACRGSGSRPAPSIPASSLGVCNVCATWQPMNAALGWMEYHSDPADSFRVCMGVGTPAKKHGMPGPRITATVAPVAMARDTEPHPAPVDRLMREHASRTPERGKMGTAPCGHVGEHLSMSYVRCLEGCEGPADPTVVAQVKVFKSKAPCPHAGTMTYKDVTSCTACGKIMRK